MGGIWMKAKQFDFERKLKKWIRPFLKFAIVTFSLKSNFWQSDRDSSNLICRKHLPFSAINLKSRFAREKATVKRK
jgi:hypothetical protein